MPQGRKLCVVAGFGPGMGQALAERFASEGYDLALLARRQPELDSAALRLERYGTRVRGYASDLGDTAQVVGAFERIRAAAGDPEVLIYNAARWHEIAAMAIDPAIFSQDLALSIVGALACAQQVYPAMKKLHRGTLLFTGGGLALRPQFGAGVSSLTAGKSGLRGLVHALATELAPEGIHVATVTIAGTVRAGTAFAPDLIADRYWKLHQQSADTWQVEVVHDGKTHP